MSRSKDVPDIALFNVERKSDATIERACTLIDKFVTVHLKVSQKDRKIHGILHSIDLETRLLYLIFVSDFTAVGEQWLEKNVTVNVFGFDSIVAIEESTEQTGINFEFDVETRHLSNHNVVSEGEVQQQKEFIQSMLSRRRLQYHEAPDGTLIAMNGALRVRPPYRTSDCVSKNEMVLSRVREMLSEEQDR